MHDIKAIREDPQAYDRAWSSRGLAPQTPKLLELDTALRAAQTALQGAQAERNDASKRIGQAKAKKDEAEATRLMAHVETLRKTLEEQGARERELQAELQGILEALPNTPAPEVPAGEDEHGNAEVRRWGNPYA